METDYSRHLDEIARDTEITTFGVIQDLLAQSRHDEAIQVLSYWEACRATSESTNSTMDEEVKLFQRRCEKLSLTLQILKSLSNESSIPKELEAKLNIVMTSVAKEKSLNAGGKFEWVDSLLIKCLRNGYWLLIDNVNLCSSAVLDRLNALLEPHGTLTIFERGLNENGTVVEIEPHEDFRLFLTMNPKNGEISRAMRNRGIEIYMLNESESEKLNELDLKSLVYAEGIENLSIIKGVIEFHKFICEILPGERPSINDMLQAASLLSKQLNYSSQSIPEKFLYAVIEVYYKTRSSFDFNCVDAICTIKDKVNEICSKFRGSSGNDLFENRVTLSTKQIESCSVFEKLRQQAVYLEHYMHIDSQYVRVSNISINYLVAFYSMFSPEDLEFRYLYLNNQLYNKSLIEKCYTIASKYKNKCQNLPYDPNWIPGTTYKIRHSNYHNLNLALYITCFYSNESTAHSDRSKKDMTLLKYMHKIKENKLEDMFNDIIVSNFLEILKHFDEYICKLMESSINLNSAEVINFINCFLWRLIFLECTSVSVKLTTAVQRYAICTNLKVHYKWFYKHSVEGIRKIANTELSASLETLLEGINNNLNTEFSAVSKLGKRYQKISNRPPPFINEHQLSIVPLFNCINMLYNIVDRNSDPVKILNIFIQEKQLRPLLIQIKSKMSYEFDDLSKEITLLGSLHEKCETLQCLQHISKFTIQILSVIDIFNHLNIKRCVIDGQKGSVIDNILIPTELVGIMALYNKSSDLRLQHEIFKSSYLYFMNSASIKPSKFLGLDNEVVVLNTFSPRLTYFMTNLLLKSESSQNLSEINLGNFRKVIMQHDNLSKIIWGNMNRLSQVSYDYINQEKEYVIYVLKSMALQFTQLDGSDFGIFHNLYEALDNIDIDISTTYCSLEKDCVTFFERFKRCILDYRQLSTVTNVDETLFLISNLYMNISTMKAIFNSQLSLIDPLAKKSMKKEYCLEAIKLFEDMKVCYELQNKIYSNYDDTVHEYHACLEDMIKRLKGKNEKLEKYVAVRDCELLYESVINVINHAFSTVLSEDYITKINLSLNDCFRCITKYASEMRDVAEKDCFNILIQEESKIITYENLIHSWNKLRNSYPDIIEPLLCNICEFLYGMKMKTSLLRKLLKSYKMGKYGIDINKHLIGLVTWPILNAEQNSYKQHIQGLVNMSASQFFETEDMKDKKFRLLKCAIHESFNHNVVHSIDAGTLNKELFLEFSNLLNVVVSIWNKQEEQKKILQDEADSLYKLKSKCNDKPEEDQIAEELEKLFPNYYSTDFSDFEQSPDLSKEQFNVGSESKEILTYEDVKSIMDLHGNLLKNYTRTEWLNPTKKGNVQSNFIQPFVEKYKVFKKVFDEFRDSLDYTMDNKLIGSLSILLAVNKYQDVSQICDNTSAKIPNKKNNDFYNDSNTEEVKSCYHILEELQQRIKELLQEWPENPVLNTIITVIDRIKNFDINSPISRFLTGFEIVLKKCHEWEEVAHSGVSLSQFHHSLTEQIISWRKLELSMWKNLLNSTYDRLNESMNKWWLYLYNIMQDFIINKILDETKLIELLQSFITTSNLAEFQGRLELLYIFHCHATYFEHSKESEMFTNILWNIYNYFEQFSLSVANKIKDLRLPIEKKIKDYVKIVRWKDISYWAVKETVNKSHKILHRHMREFQDVLQQPASSCLHNIKNNTDSETEDIWNMPQRQNPKSYCDMLDVESYLAKLSVTKKFQLIDLEGEDIFSKMESYFLKSRKLCKNTILGTGYPNLIQSVDYFINDVISTSTHLQNLEVDTTLSKDKQKSRAKQILQQKHRALSDLFKNLSLIGLSFRTGLLKNKLKKPSDDFLVKPIDLTANFSHLDNRHNEDKILTVWDRCQLYHTRSLMRADVLETALHAPAKDLSMQNIERCKGFSAHLLYLAQKQKKALIESSRTYYYLRYYIKQINDAHDGKFFLSSNTVKNILTLLENTTIVLNQYKILLNTCPLEGGFADESIGLPLFSEEVVFYKNDKIWTNIITLINEILTTVTEISCTLVKCKGSVPSIEYELFSPEFIPITDKSGLIDELSNVSSNVKKLREIFKNVVLNNSLVWLEDEYQKIEHLCKKQVTEDSPNGSMYDVEKFMEQTLMVIQNIYKKYASADKELHKDNENGYQLEQEILLQQDHLKTLLVENLSSDIALLDMKKVLMRTDKIAKIILTTPRDTRVKKIAYQCIPVFEQIIYLYQYFITQQVATYRIIVKMSSVLLNIFIELTSKGFCTPPEFSDEMDGENIGKPTDGLGLGEGQGERDVSDKIESEDQLEDAQPAGQEKEKDDDSDCKEEDKGIEMSEDFDSKLQEKKKEEREDSDESSGDEDADEQMGDTEEGAEQLDKEIWKSDEDEQEESSGEEDTKTEERGDKGEKEGEEQLGAKDQNYSKGNDQEQDDESTDERKNTKKDIDEMKEPEYDDEQIDLQHSKQTELPEPEPMDLPEDLQLDEGQEHDQDNQEENPFDIDKMKDQNETNDTEERKDVIEEDKKNDQGSDFSSDDEEITDGDQRNQEDATQEHADDKDKDVVDCEDESTDIGKDEDKAASISEAFTLDQTQSNEDHVEAMEEDKAEVTDKVESSQNKQKSTQPIDKLCQEDRPDSDGVGQSQMEKSSTGHSAQTNAPQNIKSLKTDVEEEMFKQKPGESDSKRSLGDAEEPVKKKLKTIDPTQSMDIAPVEEDQHDEEEHSEMYQHIHEGEKTKTQVFDVATDEQVQTQTKTIPSEGEEEENEDSSEPAKDIPEDDECEDIEVDNVAVEQTIKTEENKERSSKTKQHPEGDVLEENQNIDVEGEVIETSTVPRTTDSSHHTLYTNISEISATRLTIEETNNLRLEVEKQLSCWNEPPTIPEADQTWQKISSLTLSLAQDLSEQLRLVLEPTQASRLKGDYRTGRRINMRKVIPYIASQFRKDKIWLRRSKPSKREYHIVIAIDDSSSMVDNHSKELAFESVALISKALTLLESGQLSILSFGESTDIVHKLTDPFTDKSGAKILQKFRFNQNKTCVAKLVDFVTEMFQQTHLQSNAVNAKLLVVLSDGRGVFSEGETYVKQAVRRAQLANIFMVFVIIDNPGNKSSVLDIRMPVFKDGKLLGIENYMDEFPFSFYIILKNINSLPSILSDALRQWFEVVSNLE